ncbi:carboxymuconolactone decarboxylase family protein [Nonomuraea sp. NPDC049758]|uniref:carboxymuconolactone decarboxylase family protein n=1 Tax=Nonomuraea sp. NPDC049758 TaxID=3154360 RepID=UPI003430D6A3
MSTSTTTGRRSRMPNPLPFLPELAVVGEGLHKALRNGVIPPVTIALLQPRAGRLLGSTYFTVRETAALRGLGEPEERVSDELHARASALHDDRAMWPLVMAIAHIGFFTPAARIAKPIPGMPPGRNYSA